MRKEVFTNKLKFYGKGFCGNQWTYLLLLCVAYRAAEAADMTDISRLRQHILRNYDNHSRPIQNHKQATKVDVAFYIEGFEVDEKRNIFTLHAVSVLDWRDDHMKWDPKDYRNLSELQFASYELWKPDLAVYNNFAASETDHFGNTILMAFPDGTIYWVPPSKYQVGCEIDLKLWPFDTQNCYFEIGSWAHDGQQIALTQNNPNSTKLLTWDNDLPAGPINGEYFNKNREWNLISNSVQLNTRNYSCCPGPFYDVTITMTIQRKSSTHSAVVVSVAYGIAAAILVSFWLSPHANERMPLLLVTFMLNVIFLNNVYKTISSNGRNVPLVVGYYRDSLIMVTFGLFWTVLLRYIASTKRISTVPYPPLLTSFLDGWGATILCLNPRPKVGTENSIPYQFSETDEKELVAERKPIHEDLSWLSHLLDRFMFIIYSIIYICFFVVFF